MRHFEVTSHESISDMYADIIIPVTLWMRLCISERCNLLAQWAAKVVAPFRLNEIGEQLKYDAAEMRFEIGGAKFVIIHEEADYESDVKFGLYGIEPEYTIHDVTDIYEDQPF